MVTRPQLEHAVRAASRVLKDHGVAEPGLLILGSQAVLGTLDEHRLPAIVTLSDEIDICPLGDDDAESLATLIDAVLGEWSPFHEAHDFYVQGVGSRTATLPAGWESRLLTVSDTSGSGAHALCLEITDLCAAKLAAGREKDYEYVNALVVAGLVDPHLLNERAQTLAEAVRTRVVSWTNAALRRLQGMSTEN